MLDKLLKTILIPVTYMARNNFEGLLNVFFDDIYKT